MEQATSHPHDDALKSTDTQKRMIYRDTSVEVDLESPSIKLAETFEGFGSWLLLSDYCSTWILLANPAIPHVHFATESKSASLGEAPTDMRHMQSTGQTMIQIIHRSPMKPTSCLLSSAGRACAS